MLSNPIFLSLVHVVIVITLVLSVVLHILIILYIKSKPPGRTLPFDCVTIDTNIVSILAIFMTYTIIAVGSITEHNIKKEHAIILAFLCWCIIHDIFSCMLISSFIRIVFMKRPEWIIGKPDDQLRKITWIFRFLFGGT